MSNSGWDAFGKKVPENRRDRLKDFFKNDDLVNLFVKHIENDSIDKLFKVAIMFVSVTEIYMGIAIGTNDE